MFTWWRLRTEIFERECARETFGKTSFIVWTW